MPAVGLMARTCLMNASRSFGIEIGQDFNQTTWPELSSMRNTQLPVQIGTL